MNKKEVLELKRRFKKDQATFTQLVGCYVDCNHNKVCKFGEPLCHTSMSERSDHAALWEYLH